MEQKCHSHRPDLPILTQPLAFAGLSLNLISPGPVKTARRQLLNERSSHEAYGSIGRLSGPGYVHAVNSPRRGRTRKHIRIQAPPRFDGYGAGQSRQTNRSRQRFYLYRRSKRRRGHLVSFVLRKHGSAHQKNDRRQQSYSHAKVHHDPLDIGLKRGRFAFQFR